MSVTLVNPYATVDQIRAQLKDSAAVVDEDLIRRAINAASRGIDDYCSGDVPKSRRFWQDATVKTRIFNCEDSKFAYVDDISTRTGLTVKTDDNNDGIYENTWTIGTDFNVWPLNADVDGNDQPMAFWKIVAVGDKRFPVYDRRAGLQVQAKFGWPAVPVEVNQACVLRTISLLLRKDSPLGVVASNEWGALRVPTFDPDVGAMLRPFVKRRPWSKSYISDQGANSLFHRRLF